MAGAAAVLSFATVRDLAAAAGYPANLAWLLPVVIDATAGVGSRIWLSGGGQPAAVRYARALALAAAMVTIGANVLQHGLVAHHLLPPWWLVAVLAAVPPTALVAVAHQVALLARPAETKEPAADIEGAEWSGDHEDPVELGTAGEVPQAELDVVQADADAHEADLRERTRRILAESPVPVGRRRLAELLDVSDWQARQLLVDLTPNSESSHEPDITYARS